MLLAIEGVQQWRLWSFESREKLIQDIPVIVSQLFYVTFRLVDKISHCLGKKKKFQTIEQRWFYVFILTCHAMEITSCFNMDDFCYLWCWCCCCCCFLQICCWYVLPDKTISLKGVKVSFERFHTNRSITFLQCVVVRNMQQTLEWPTFTKMCPKRSALIFNHLFDETFECFNFMLWQRF